MKTFPSTTGPWKSPRPGPHAMHAITCASRPPYQLEAQARRFCKHLSTCRAQHVLAENDPSLHRNLETDEFGGGALGPRSCRTTGKLAKIIRSVCVDGSAENVMQRTAATGNAVKKDTPGQSVGCSLGDSALACHVPSECQRRWQPNPPPKQPFKRPSPAASLTVVHCLDGVPGEPASIFASSAGDLKGVWAFQHPIRHFGKGHR